MSRTILLVILVFACAGLIDACGPRQFTTLTIYDKPAVYVRLEFDRMVKKGSEHSHPSSLTQEQIAAVLSGVRIEEHLVFARGDMVPAFTDNDIAFFAPLLSLAFSKATPEEIVTFYETRYLSPTRREVTSGGLFVQGDVLHLILANYWSPTDHRADFIVTDTQHDRLTPMASLSTYNDHLDFEPQSAKWERPAGGFERFFQRDSRELAILYKQLPPHPVVEAAPQSEGIP